MLKSFPLTSSPPNSAKRLQDINTVLGTRHSVLGYRGRVSWNLKSLPPQVLTGRQSTYTYPIPEDSLPLTSWNADAISIRGRATTGTITQLTHGKLCGTIRTVEGQNVYFHGRDLEGARYNEMELGGAVTFELIDDRVSGARAARIRVAKT